VSDPDPTTTQTRTIDLSVEVPGSPEQVWEAIATGPGISSWFIPHQVEPHVGGAVVMDFGGFGKETARVAAWEPPARVVFESLEGRDDGRLAYEWLVEAREGGTCVVRLVNSGFGTGQDWDNDYDGMSVGWRLFLENLRLYLTHFPGQHGRAVTPVAMVPGPNPTAWEALCSALGVSPDLRAGDRFETAGAGVPPLAGVIDGAGREAAIAQYRMVLDAPANGSAFVAAEGKGDQIMLSVWLYLYGDQPSDDPWTPWLAERFPAPAPVEAG
jgi:uncharacterized protein YndB with AHSA1/START domain